MKNNGVIHFSQTINVKAADIGEPEDSGNGYYSYTYTHVPYTGDVSADEARQNIYKAIRAKWYSTYSGLHSMGYADIIPNSERTGGIIRVQHIYHHGD